MRPISAFDNIKVLDLTDMPNMPTKENPNSPSYTPIENKKPNHGGSIEKTKRIGDTITSTPTLKLKSTCFEGGSKMIGNGLTSDMKGKRWTIDAYPNSEEKNTPEI